MLEPEQGVWHGESSMQEEWASLEDCAVLFRYLWHQDFPVSATAVGDRRTDWTIHVGVVVRNIADLLGLWARFESGRMDAVFRSLMHLPGPEDRLALEWEWEGVCGNELGKLRRHANKETLLYTVLVTYVHTSDGDTELQGALNHVAAEWKAAARPLLLVLIEYEESKGHASRRTFKKLRTFRVNTDGTVIPLGVSLALPWEIEGSRWSESRTP